MADRELRIRILVYTIFHATKLTTLLSLSFPVADIIIGSTKVSPNLAIISLGCSFLIDAAIRSNVSPIFVVMTRNDWHFFVRITCNLTINVPPIVLLILLLCIWFFFYFAVFIAGGLPSIISTRFIKKILSVYSWVQLIQFFCYGSRRRDLPSNKWILDERINEYHQAYFSIYIPYV